MKRIPLLFVSLLAASGLFAQYNPATGQYTCRMPLIEKKSVLAQNAPAPDVKALAFGLSDVQAELAKLQCPTGNDKSCAELRAKADALREQLKPYVGKQVEVEGGQLLIELLSPLTMSFTAAEGKGYSLQEGPKGSFGMPAKYIDVDELQPDSFSLDMFSPTDLLNSPDQWVTGRFGSTSYERVKREDLDAYFKPDAEGRYPESYPVQQQQHKDWIAPDALMLETPSDDDEILARIEAGEPSLPIIHVGPEPIDYVTPRPDHVAGELLVMLSDNNLIRELENSLSNLGLPVISDKNSSRSFKTWKLVFDPATDLNSALEKTKALPGVVLAQFNHYSNERNTTPNDPQFGTMWDMENTGQNGGTVDADIDAPEAWDISTGGLTAQGDTIVVAVVDGGFYLAHEDLNFWKNYAEIPGNGIDDDNNGYIDDYDGWNAYNSTGTITNNSHGTHVSGTVGAIGNNSLGVMGINWGVKVMPVMGSSNTESEVVEAYGYVFDARRLYNQTNGAQGAFVVSTNSSFGVDQGQPASYPIWCAMYDSLGSVGILSAAATANQNWDIDQVGDIPTACGSSYMLAVTNTTRFDARNSGAAYGQTTIDIGAPGTTIMSTYPNNSYQAITGTSMATPHIAGTVALMYAAACSQLITDYKAHPDSIALVMRDYMMHNVDSIAALSGLCTSEGRLNLFKTLQAVQAYCSTTSSVEVHAPPSAFELQNVFPNPAHNWVELAYNAPGAMQVNVSVYNMLGQEVLSVSKSANGGMNNQKLDLSSLQAGMYTISIRSGNTVSNVQRVVVY